MALNDQISHQMKNGYIKWNIVIHDVIGFDETNLGGGEYTLSVFLGTKEDSEDYQLRIH